MRLCLISLFFLSVFSCASTLKPVDTGHASLPDWTKTNYQCQENQKERVILITIKNVAESEEMALEKAKMSVAEKIAETFRNLMLIQLDKVHALNQLKKWNEEYFIRPYKYINILKPSHIDVSGVIMTDKLCFKTNNEYQCYIQISVKYDYYYYKRDSITRNYDNKRDIIEFYLELEKAFDSIDKELWDKLDTDEINKECR